MQIVKEVKIEDVKSLLSDETLKKLENDLKQMEYSDSDIKDFINKWKQGSNKLPKEVKDYLDGLYQIGIFNSRAKPLVLV